jgi:hypothetical protein
MPTSFKSVRIAWMALAVLALPALCAPALAQDPQAATPPATAPATPTSPTDVAPSDAPAASATISDAPAGTLIAPPVDGAPPPAPPESGEPPADTRALDETVQDLKKDVVDLNKELFVLEEELLFPANTQVAVFVSMDIGEFFALDSLSLKIDNKEVANYLYTPREAEALLKGGVHRVYLGNLKVGDHQLVAFFEGKGPNNRDYKRGANLKFEKGVGAKYLELKITDRQRKAQPEFAIKDWE